MVSSGEILIATAKLEWLRNGGVISLSTAARLAEHGFIVDEMMDQFEQELADDIDTVLG
jgi:hypothetical protein